MSDPVSIDLNWPWREKAGVAVGREEPYDAAASHNRLYSTSSIILRTRLPKPTHSTHALGQFRFRLSISQRRRIERRQVHLMNTQVAETGRHIIDGIHDWLETPQTKAQDEMDVRSSTVWDAVCWCFLLCMARMSTTSWSICRRGQAGHHHRRHVDRQT
jgi:hypothetical protein